MRLSIDTLCLLARLGDACATATVLWMDGDKTTEAWSYAGNIGAGWPGVRADFLRMGA